jgi:hypothetical protein
VIFFTFLLPWYSEMPRRIETTICDDVQSLYILNRERFGKITNCMAEREGSMHKGR